MQRTASALYVSVPLLIFVWTWASPAVSIGDFYGPVTEYFSTALLMWGAVAMMLVCFSLIRNILRQSPEPRFEFLHRWFRYQRDVGFAQLILPFVAFVVTMGSFTVHKTLALPTLGFAWDAAMIELDRWLFLGAEPWRLSHNILSNAQATRFTDLVYHAWFYPMFLVYVFCGLMVVGPVARVCYISTYLIGWFLIGCLLASAFSSAGPAYDGVLFESGGAYADLLSRLSEQSGRVGGLDSQQYQIMLLQGHQEGKVALGHGISAMPSMHVALAAMWTMLFFCINRWLGVAGVIYTTFVWIGSFHLGWHYAADGMFSSALVIIVWFAVRSMLLRSSASWVSEVETDAPQAVPAE